MTNEEIILNGILELTGIGKIKTKYNYGTHLNDYFISFKRTTPDIRVATVNVVNNKIVVNLNIQRRPWHLKSITELIELDLADPTSIENAAIQFKAYVAKCLDMVPEHFEILHELRKRIGSGVINHYLFVYINDSRAVYFILTNGDGLLNKNPTHISLADVTGNFGKELVPGVSIIDSIFALSDPQCFEHVLDRYYQLRNKK